MRYAEPSAGDTSTLYAWLLTRELEAQRRGSLPWTPEQPAYSHRPERLTALRAGESVNLCVSELPKWAREGQPCHWWRCAVVQPDGTVEFVDDSGEWLAENNL